MECEFMNDKLIELMSMSSTELLSEIAKQNYNMKELETFNKGKELVDKLSELNSEESYRKVSIGVIAYILYKRNGGK